MRVLILGGDGYLGWPTAMDLAARGHDVVAVDNYLRRKLARDTHSEPLMDNPDLPERARLFRRVSGKSITTVIGDVSDYGFLEALVREVKPDALVHYAEQPSAPYSMRGYDEARLTLTNNLLSTLNVSWAVMQAAPQCHIVKLGTMGEYGTPNIDIEEGWIEIEHKGRKDRFLYPRQAASLYHTTKIQDTDLLWFYVRMAKLRVTDLMQGPVYGLSTPEAERDPGLWPNFHYDDIFGTVVNRFLVQAVAGVPLTVYGEGEQTRGYLNLLDTLACVRLALTHPAAPGELRIMNQFTECFSVNVLAGLVVEAAQQVGIQATVAHIPNPRQEAEQHYYQPAHSALPALGLTPHLLTPSVLADMLVKIRPFEQAIEQSRIFPRVAWSAGASCRS